MLLPALANAQNIPYSDFVLSAYGRPIAGANVSVCNSPGLATTSAQVTNNVAVLTLASNPITAGFAAGQTLQVAGFTGSDTYFNAGMLSGGVITGGYTILSGTSSTVTFTLTHANQVASSNGDSSGGGTPEQQRVSLRALAAELGTSHQLLGFYLKDLDRWQQQKYKREAKAIRDRAAKEKRHMTPWEHSQVENLEMSAFYCMIDKLLSDQFDQIEREVNQGKPVTAMRLRVLKTLAGYGHLKAQETLRRIMAGSGKRNPAPTPGV